MHFTLLSPTYDLYLSSSFNTFNHTRSSSWPWVSHLAAALAASLAAFEADDSVDTIEDAMISQSSSAKVRNLAQVKSALRLSRHDWVVCQGRNGSAKRQETCYSPITNDTTTTHRHLRLSFHAHLAGALKVREVSGDTERWRDRFQCKFTSHTGCSEMISCAEASRRWAPIGFSGSGWMSTVLKFCDILSATCWTVIGRERLFARITKVGLLVDLVLLETSSNGE